MHLFIVCGVHLHSVLTKNRGHLDSVPSYHVGPGDRTHILRPHYPSCCSSLLDLEGSVQSARRRRIVSGGEA